jgi:hypothetical protein
MLKNITLSADEQLIKKAREKAHSERTTLNNCFRRWLKQFIASEITQFDFNELMNSLNYVNPGKKFTRDELNER